MAFLLDAQFYHFFSLAWCEPIATVHYMVLLLSYSVQSHKFMDLIFLLQHDWHLQKGSVFLISTVKSVLSAFIVTVFTSQACLICFNLIFICIAVQCLRFYFSIKVHWKVKPKTTESNQQHIFTKCTIAQLVALSPCSKKVLGSHPGFQSFCMKFAWSFSPCTYGFLRSFLTSSHSPKASLLGWLFTLNCTRLTGMRNTR